MIRPPSNRPYITPRAAPAIALCAALAAALAAAPAAADTVTLTERPGQQPWAVVEIVNICGSPSSARHVLETSRGPVVIASRRSLPCFKGDYDATPPDIFTVEDLPEGTGANPPSLDTWEDGRTYRIELWDWEGA